MSKQPDQFSRQQLSPKMSAPSPVQYAIRQRFEQPVHHPGNGRRVILLHIRSQHTTPYWSFTALLIKGIWSVTRSGRKWYIQCPSDALVKGFCSCRRGGDDGMCAPQMSDIDHEFHVLFSRKGGAIRRGEKCHWQYMSKQTRREVKARVSTTISFISTVAGGQSLAYPNLRSMDCKDINTYMASSYHQDPAPLSASQRQRQRPPFHPQTSARSW